MLIIHQRLADALVRLAQADPAHESGGVLAGPRGSGVPTRCLAMDRSALPAHGFGFDPGWQRRTGLAMARHGEEAVALFLSRTRSQAYPDRTEIGQATDPELHYLIVSTDARHPPGLRSFRIGCGTVVEERVVTVPAYREAPFNLRIDTGDTISASAA